jgi:adenylate cyclase class IV
MTHATGHEIEIKLAVPEIAAVERRLAALGARRGPRLHEVNAVFDTRDQRLRQRGQLLRLRVEWRVGRRRGTAGLGPADGARGDRSAHLAAMLFPAGRQKALVTLKARAQGAAAGRAKRRRSSPPSRPAYKVRQEIEFPVPDSAAYRNVLAELGFRPAFYYEKFRTLYRLPGLNGVAVALDETPIGTFLELEGRPGEIARARKKLGYEAREIILKSYGALYAAHQRARRQPFRHMVFG